VADDRSPAALERVLYTATATAEGGREGRAHSDDGALDVRLAPPAEMGGRGELGTNPEQLFAAGYAGCFGSAVAGVARRRRIDPGRVAITARVGIGPLAGGAFGLTVELLASLPDVDAATAGALVQAAHAVCPYSNATRGNVPVTLRVVAHGDAASETG
jgi:osmotically inducible protein OsmC